VEDVAQTRSQGRARGFAWQPYGKQTFERAAREGRFILIHGAAEWCHWCHVMEEVTYTDGEVARLIAARFIPVRVDVDQRPDFMERYAAWGWPATIILSPQAQELGKYRGYLPPQRLAQILRAVDTATSVVDSRQQRLDVPAPTTALPWIAAHALRTMDGFYDVDLGGWGRKQKLPLGANLEVELLRAAAGDQRALQRATQTLHAQRALLDPVWGGVFQYSVGGAWDRPHFEKLMTVQAATLLATARAAALVPQARDDATSIHRYLRTHLRAPNGAFFTNQDADVGAHDPKAPFVDGHTFYALDDAGRKAVGTPWVDQHIYARENGLAIRALVALYVATGDNVALLDATAAARQLMGSHVFEDGSVARDPASPSQPFFLLDVATLGQGLLDLHAAAPDPALLARATSMAAWMVRAFSAPNGAALFDHTPDADAAGVFSQRLRSLTANVEAARFLASLAQHNRDPAPMETARAILADTLTPRALDEQGRMLGELLLALHAVGAWQP